MERWAMDVGAKITALPAEQRVAAADLEFDHLWTWLRDVAFRNPCPNGMLSFAQALEDTTHRFQIESLWQPLHKGAHFYNMGLMYFAAGEVDCAFKFFLLADEEDAANKGSNPGVVARMRA
jgi:hypothetical protein